MAVRFGRIQLGSIISEWEGSHPINPRFLAGELAAVLRTLAPADRPIHETHASTVLAVVPAVPVTYGALADYFETASQGSPAPAVITSGGPIPASGVLLWRQWITPLVDEAAQRAALVAGLAAPVNDSGIAGAVANASLAIKQAEQLPQPSGSEPGYLKLRQAQQRRDGERSATEQLDAEKVARLRAEQEVAELRARLAASEAAKQQLQEENQQLSEELKAEIRERRRAEADSEYFQDQLEDTFVFRECLRADNPTSPPELRMAFQCWRAITRDATHNPSDRGGRGVHGLVDDWVASTEQQLNNEQLNRLRAMVSWRKRGAGAIPSA